MTAPGDEWFILFGDGGAEARSAWWQRFLAPGYRHVMAARGFGPSMSLTVQHVGSHLVVAREPLHIDDLVLELLKLGEVRHALRMVVPPARRRAQLRPPLTCVEAVKAVIGLSAPLCVSPAQLARRLRAMGAWEVPTFSLMTKGHA